ncbi:DUF294 nucleotidyltransferase-like domain-containing protein [Salinivibrio sp. YCSC6]|uniref:DUF294 nucleotidyltransferase-like domain-containing protein n=1 Tax=Salinivibrio sp. YCSC6 TaxID=2003370 RepID=UPI000BBBB92F|nr:DUF294 nucleotidyltransferase-like domain-containing protein [Salinivibrio sp. YCSC6]PCE68286.1 cyclic nucleotide-binding protein [Salinivibrio sp. YCSC6]QCF34829.1 cyclic nucleotide-binding/CBS domain-containing protein [Salinivibrio sp. YCSC6]
MPEPFDTSHAPFDCLTASQVKQCRQAIDVAYFRRGDTLLAAGDSGDQLFIIIKGSVEEVSEDGKETFSHYTTDDLFDVPAILNGTAKHQYRALEDTLCHLLPADVFLAIYHTNQDFSAYFDTNLQRRQQLIAQARQQQNLAEFMLTRIDDTNIQPALRVTPDVPLKDATAKMKAQRCDCALVDYEDGSCGIITRTNLLHALVLDGHDQSVPVGNIATRPVISVERGDFLFHAMITMTRQRVKRVRVVDDQGQTVGTLDLPQVLSLFSTHSHVLNLRIARAQTVDELVLAANSQSKLVHTLFNNGIHTRFVMKLIATVNEQIMEKAFRLIVPELYQQQCCLVVMGSEGRGEQVLKTDQDNALILADDLTWPECQTVMEAFSHTLNLLGYPPCPGQVMVSNPKWVKSASQWQQTILNLAQSANHQSVMDLAILADAHPVAGDSQLIDAIQTPLKASLTDNMLTLNTFVRPALAFKVPLTVFGSLKSGKEGLDIKKGGIFPIVHGIRTMSLEKVVSETNTFERIERLANIGTLAEETAENLAEALKLFIRLRLRQQLSGEQQSNYIDVSALPSSERDLLRHGLHVVKKFKESLAYHYHVRD